MPKVIPFEKINDNHYTFEGEVKLTGYDCRIQVPARLGREIPNKKVKVTIEVLE